MTTFYAIVAMTLLFALSGGLYQVVRGPTPADRLLVIQLFGTASVAVLILLAEATNDPVLVDIALALALLAAITMIAFVRCTWTRNYADDARD